MNLGNNNNSQCFGSGESAHLVFRAGNCSLLVDLPVCFYRRVWLWGCTFGDNASKVTPKRFLRQTDCRRQSQGSNSDSFFIREFWLLKICHLPFLLHSVTEIVPSEHTSLNICAQVRHLYMSKTNYLTFLGECWNRDVLAERKEGQRRERSGGVSSVWESDHHQGQHLRPRGHRRQGETGKKKKST